MNNLPIEVLEEIFLRVGKTSYKELSLLRLVCKTWNESINMKLLADNPSAEWGRIIASNVKRCLESWECWDPLSVEDAASLAQQGHLRSVKRIRLLDMNLSSVPAENLATLVSSVTARVDIQNISGSCLVTILDSVKSERLYIRHQSLDSEETRALVRAMETRVEEVWLYEEVTLDIRVLMEYSGQGRCRWVECKDANTKDRYMEDLMTWATRRNWEVNSVTDDYFCIVNLADFL